ncbi:MAG: glycerophosphoryl diester phosphodiesterase [Frankiales bacterium]|jgi:glycerophosphoryl diester phosphodiesterase|nr:glycerophosphoryl diester phosphodiesterase [Frankiales bacterium]
MEILGHRGRPTPATPENTLASVEAALAGGADGVEVDVRLTADGIAVCCHDADLVRVAGVARDVSSLTLAELTAVRVGGHPVPTVAAVLAAVGARGRVVLDLKPEPRPERLLTAVRRAVAEAGVRSGEAVDLVLSSFERDILEVCAAEAPEVPRAVIIGSDQPCTQLIAQALARGDEAMHVEARTLFVNPDLVAAAHARGLLVRAWTVNRLIDVRLLGLLAVDAVISDVPDTVRALAGRPAAMTSAE